MGWDKDFLENGEIKFDTTAIEHFYLYTLFIFNRFESFGKPLFLFLSEGEVNDLDLFIFIKAQELEQPQKHLGRNETISSYKLGHSRIRVVVKLLLNKVDLYNVKDKRMKLNYLAFLANNLNPFIGTIFAAIFAVAFWLTHGNKLIDLVVNILPLLFTEKNLQNGCKF